MKETKGRSFVTLKSGMEEREFRQFRKIIAEEYANSAYEFAKSYFLKKYDIKQECYYQILSSAVVENIVDDETVERMQLKAIANQKAHMAQAGLSTRKHYDKLRRLRLENKEISKFCDEEIRQLATEFAYSHLGKEEFAEKNGITVRILSLLLEKAIEELIVDDIIYEAIKKRSIERASKENREKTVNYFKTLKRRRNSNIRKLFSI